MHNISEIHTMPDLLLRAVNRDPEGECLIFPNSRTTYAQQYARAVQVARALAAAGIGEGDGVGILMPNCQEYVDLILGAHLVRAVPVLVNSRFKAQEIAYVLPNADVKILFTTNRVAEHVDFVALLDEGFPNLAGQADVHNLTLADAPLLKRAVLVGEASHDSFIPYQAFLDAGASASENQIESSRALLSVAAPAMMLYTSGTTSMPKGCVLTHEAVVRTATQIGRTRLFLTGHDRVWCALPMFHMAFLLPFTGSLDAGATVLTMEHFDPSEAMEYMQREGATVNFSIFPAVANAILNHPDYDDAKLNIRAAVNIGPEGELRRMQAKMPSVSQVGAYGLTECGGICAIGDIRDTLDQRVETCGTPLWGNAFQVRDLETDKVLGAGEPGELLIRGVARFKGYHKDEAKNRECFTEDGWFRTGDVCVLDADSRVAWRDRIKDMLKVGGENVAAAEIETQLHKHPSVRLAQVVSAPDPKYVEVPVAYIELVPGESATEEELIAFCKGKIASFKVPRHVRFVTEWPMSATKIKKAQLREWIAHELREA